jgi:hypothetical protein
MRHLPEEVQTRQDVLPNGYAYVFTHRTLGLLGRLILTDVGPNQMEIRSEVAGHPDDPMTRERQAILQPIVDMVIQALNQRGVPDAGPPPTGMQPLSEATLTSDGSDHVIPSTLLQCDTCDGFIALIIYADELRGTLEDHARLMYEHIEEVNLPTYVIGPQQPPDGRAEVLVVHPERQPVQQLTEAAFEELLAPVRRSCCG